MSNDYQVACEELAPNVRVVIRYDTHPESPREWGTLTHLAFNHRDVSADEYKNAALKAPPYYGGGWEAAREDWEAKLMDTYPVLIECEAVNMYDHSGRSLSFGSGRGWDNGVVGLMFTTPEQIKECWAEEWLGTPEQIARIRTEMANELKVYNQWMEGEVYGFEVEVWNAEPGRGWEVEDSCWGYYSQEDAMSEGKDTAQSYLKKEIPVKGTKQ